MLLLPCKKKSCDSGAPCEAALKNNSKCPSSESSCFHKKRKGKQYEGHISVAIGTPPRNHRYEVTIDTMHTSFDLFVAAGFFFIIVFSGEFVVFLKKCNLIYYIRDNIFEGGKNKFTHCCIIVFYTTRRTRWRTSRHARQNSEWKRHENTAAQLELRGGYSALLKGTLIVASKQTSISPTTCCYFSIFINSRPQTRNFSWILFQK